MLQWLKNFLEWQEGEGKNISGLGSYVLRNWWKLLILLIVIIAIIYLIMMVIKLVKSLFK